jgi:twitching motility protein PilT
MIDEFIEIAFKKGASDLHLKEGEFPVVRVDGELQRFGDKRLQREDLRSLLKELLGVEDIDKEVDFAYQSGDIRLRVNTFKSMDRYAIALRLLSNKIRDLTELGLPNTLNKFADLSFGIVLVTGPTGSGKSTTLAALIETINKKRSTHIITVEDPIEYVYTPKKAYINQREIETDTESFSSALRYALRQDPDVILVGEMRDLETISLAIRAAETGHLVFSTLHTSGAAATIERIVDIFPAHQQKQIRVQLANTIQGVVYQRLVQKKGGGRIPIQEIMIANSAIRNLIREEKIHMIDNVIATNAAEGMVGFDSSLIKAYRKGIITKESAYIFAKNKKSIVKNL